MRGHSPLLRTVTRATALRWRGNASMVRQWRGIQISSDSSSSDVKVDAFGAPVDGSVDSADARFEVLGSPNSSLLSVTLSPSQNLYTRRGTLVGVAGKAENVQSHLSLLAPVTRAALGIPFLYQRLVSTSPTTLLVSPTASSRSVSTTSITLLHLPGTSDWLVASRRALLAWTGHSLTLTPRVHDYALGAAHWGSTLLSGRGLVALAAPGEVYRLTLGEGEDFVVHPANVLAYEVTRRRPEGFRFGSGVGARLALSVPSVPESLTSRLPAAPQRWTRFVRAVRGSDTWRFLARMLRSLRTAARRSVYGDRLFLRFEGPLTLFVSSRAAGRVAELLSAAQVDEIYAGTPPEHGALRAVEMAVADAERSTTEVKRQVQDAILGMRVASVGKDGKVTLAEAKDLNEFVR